MNKTLLLILCDFLLLTILSMWKMEEEAPPPNESSSDSPEEASVAAMAMMEQDLLDTLQYSLEEEQAEQASLSEDLAEKAAELERQQRELAERESRIQNLESTLTDAERREQELQRQRERLAEEKSSLEQTVASVQENYQQVSRRLEQTESEALQSQAQARLLQEELQQKLKEIESKEQALAKTAQELNSTKQQVQELDMKVKMSQQENAFLQESVTELKGAVVEERSERQRLQEQAGVLAQGVSDLAASSQDIRQEIRSSFEINANQLFSDFVNNQVVAQIDAVKYSRNRYVNTRDRVSTVLVSDGEQVYALMHVESGPFDLGTNPAFIRSMQLTLNRRGSSVTPSHMNFLALDPRVVAMPLSKSQVESLGSKPYLTALNPFKFPEAVLVNRQGDYYGEVEFKLDSDTPGFVKMQNKIFSSLFGEFSPSTGDIVLSKTGELLGIMVNKRYCALVNNFVSAARYEAQGAVDEDALRRVLRILNNTVDSFPRELR
ncbi:hypothetical protein [Pelagicoccus sp. SDUM812003]|uniref:hypothetical protein n=1 Tax=Pelagicoccus sp. SDUM812003 TaxID=3041267 RepID=UPI00280F76D3|nr:hypothetical protein [Pelagicoccus sp. SDUM812003]MDQ8202522.1 hypothetical protein [Pelagicoccus sp. SDUM812003]